MKDRDATSRESGKLRAQSESAKKPAVLSRHVQAKLGEQLRSMYGDVVDQGIPDRFVELLKKLDSKSDDGEPK